ncbi:MAG: NAD(P)-binding domain-containing protein, partial [Bacteroidia bacterium]|nr:NAD(P)-binding domain-containing protein [Bacteroidia bacterium]
MTRFNLSFAGAGRVAGALCKEMFNSGFKIIQVVSENESDGKPLAEFCNASWSSELVFNDKNDIIIVAVPDHKLKDVLSQVKYNSETIIVHTAGSFGLEVFPASVKRTGVFYPLQTFSEGRIIRFKDLPILLEASEND